MSKKKRTKKRIDNPFEFDAKVFRENLVELIEQVPKFLVGLLTLAVTADKGLDWSTGPIVEMPEIHFGQKDGAPNERGDYPALCGQHIRLTHLVCYPTWRKTSVTGWALAGNFCKQCMLRATEVQEKGAHRKKRRRTRKR